MKWKRIKILLLCAVLLVVPLCGTGAFGVAALTGTGVVVVDDNLRVRAGPGTNYDKIGDLYNGDVVNILESVTGTDGGTWYRISASGIANGYVHSDYIRVEPEIDIVPDEDFEAYLTSQGFPESYKEPLRKLHTLYPKWIFTAQKINLDFQTVLDEESKADRNLVPKSSPDSWKSMDADGYNWETGEFYTYSGGDWVKASREILAYYMDPRNFLDETYIFQFENQSYSSAHTVEGVANLLKGTFMAGNYTCPDTKETKSYAQTFVEIAKLTNVSAYHLASRARLEQGVNGSPLGHGTVPGYPNIFNFYNIQANGVTDADVLRNGAIYASRTDPATVRPWTNQYKSIHGGAIFIGKNYINMGQDTPYLEKFDVVDGGNGLYYHQYMQSIQAPSSEALASKRGYTDEMLNNTAFVFKIPIYNNMPAEACEKPNSAEKSDNTLIGLSVAGYTLTPSFSRYQTSYELVVGADVGAVTISAQKSHPAATVTGTGIVALKAGNNTVSIVVTAPTGVTRTYTIQIFKSSDSGDESRPTFDGSYTIGSEVTGVQPGTSTAVFLAKLGVKNGTAKLYTAADAEKTSGTVATGDIVKVYQGSKLYYTYPVLIFGDLNGDGAITAVDMLRMRRHFLGLDVLQGVNSKACDVNRDGSNTPVDQLYFQKYLLNMAQIQQ